MMNSDKINKLENNPKLKKKIFGKGIWRSYAIVPPSLILFAGIFGIIYLLNIDKLISYYTIPFVLLFCIGTIWLKATRRYLVNKKITEGNDFLVCLTIPFSEQDNKNIRLFSTGKNRNNRYYLEKEKKDILEDQDISLTSITKKAVLINDSDTYLVSLPNNSKFLKTGHNINNDNWIIYSGQGTVHILSQSEMNKYL